MASCENTPVGLEEVIERWEREELLVLERDPKAHQRIAALMEDPRPETAAEVSCLLTQALAQPTRPEARRRAAEMVWAQLKAGASPAHAKQAEELIANLEEDCWAAVYLKRLFRVLAGQQKNTRIQKSSYLVEP